VEAEAAAAEKRVAQVRDIVQAGRRRQVHDPRPPPVLHRGAKKLPIHVTQPYAGQSDINTTKEYDLSVQEADAKAARRAQRKLLGKLKGGEPTDPKLTLKPQKNAFPGRTQQAARGRR
jgi:hypothetical protein